jgi:hypothetical protein
MRTRAALVVAGSVGLCVSVGAVIGPGVVRGLRYEQQDPMAECANAYPELKTTLVRAEWRWLPPEIRCVFEVDGATRSLPSR